MNSTNENNESLDLSLNYNRLLFDIPSAFAIRVRFGILEAQEYCFICRQNMGYLHSLEIPIYHREIKYYICKRNLICQKLKSTFGQFWSMYHYQMACVPTIWKDRIINLPLQSALPELTKC